MSNNAIALADLAKMVHQAVVLFLVSLILPTIVVAMKL